MALLDLFPTAAGLSLEQVDVSGETITLHLKVIARFASCPVCGRASARVHSRYQRTLTDLPCHGRLVQLRVTARRFFCSTPDCPRTVFAERLPVLAKPRARSTAGLGQAHPGADWPSAGLDPRQVEPDRGTEAAAGPAGTGVPGQELRGLCSALP